MPTESEQSGESPDDPVRRSSAPTEVPHAPADPADPPVRDGPVNSA